MADQTQTKRKADLNVLEKVLDTFFQIDKKILELHKCSSDDFLSLNKTLKKNHQKAMFITKNVSEAFDKTGIDGNLKTLFELKLSLSELTQDILGFEQELNTNLEILERVQSNFSLMFVPINNFRQNLTSLKLLLSNIKLTNNLYDRSLKNFSENESQQILGVINKVKDSCPVFEENIFVIQKHLKTLYQDLLDIKDLIFSQILQKLEILNSDLNVIEKHNTESQKEKDSIDRLVHNCKSSVGSIITNLQYHDIIRQKMEHIQQTHKLIIGELNGSGNEPDSTAGASSNPFFLQIPQIIEIQTAQLLHTNKDYQNAIEHISKKMIEIGRDMTTMTRTFKGLSVFEYKGKSVSKEGLENLFSSLVNEKQICVEKFRVMAEDVALIQRIVNNLFDKFKDLELIENSIEQTIIDKISFGNLLVSEERETASQAQQVLKLYADNHFEKNKIRTLFLNTSSHLKAFVKSNSEYVYNKKGMDKINTNLESASVNISRIIESIDFIEGVQLDVVKMSREVDIETSDVVNNVKYYDFFEKTIEELIESFESINSLLKDHGHDYSDQGDRKRGLEQIEKYYTMKSERIIHNASIVKKGGGLNGLYEVVESTSAENNNNEGNDVEFF